MSPGIVAFALLVGTIGVGIAWIARIEGEQLDESTSESDQTIPAQSLTP